MVKKRKKKLFEKKFIPKYTMKTGEFYDQNSEGTGKIFPHRFFNFRYLSYHI